MQQLLQQAKTVMVDRDTAMKAGDWATYGAKDAELTSIIDQLLALTGEQAASASPSPSATPAP